MNFKEFDYLKGNFDGKKDKKSYKHSYNKSSLGRTIAIKVSKQCQREGLDKEETKKEESSIVRLCYGCPNGRKKCCMCSFSKKTGKNKLKGFALMQERKDIAELSDNDHANINIDDKYLRVLSFSLSNPWINI